MKKSKKLDEFVLVFFSTGIQNISGITSWRHTAPQHTNLTKLNLKIQVVREKCAKQTIGA